MSNIKKLIAASDSWRDKYNPLRGLSMQRAISLLESMNSGDFTDLMWLYKHIEETDPDGIALVERGLSSLEELDYNIKIASQDKNPTTWDEKLAMDQQSFLASRYEALDNLNEVVAHLALGFFRKYAFCQIITNSNGLPSIECHDQWNFVRDGLKGDFYWNPEAKSTMFSSLGDPLDIERDRLIVMDYARHVDRYGLIKFLRSNMAEKDWDGFIEVFGFDQTIVVLPEGIEPGKMDEYLKAASDISDGGNGALPNGATIDHGNDSRGQQPFKPRLEWLQQQHVLAGTGGMLTMLTQSGSGTLAGGAHAETWKTLSRARGKRISELLHQTFDRSELAIEFPGKPVLAYFELATNEEQDVGDVVDHAVKIRTAFPDKTMDPAEFMEKTGYRLVDSTQPEEPTKPQLEQKKVEKPEKLKAGESESSVTWYQNFIGRLLGREAVTVADKNAEKLEKAAAKAIGKAAAGDLQPYYKRIADALELDDEAMITEMQAIYDETPEALEAVMDNPAIEEPLAEMIADAIVIGAETGANENEKITRQND